MCLTYYPVTFNDQLGRPMRRRRFIPTPGVGAANDGLVGLGCGTGQQWLDFCVMVEHPEVDGGPVALPRPDEAGAGHRRLDRRADRRRGARPGLSVPDPQRAHRQRRRTSPRSSTSPTGERSRSTRGTGRPIRFRRTGSGAARLRPPEPAPSLGELPIDDALPRERSAGRSAGGASTLPFEGLRILDMTSYWAGPLAGHVLALLGAEVIHLESSARPDGARLVGGVPQTEERYWERGPIFAALNTNKKSLTIDLRERRGHRSGASLRRNVRRGHRELHPTRAGPTGSRLRDAPGRSIPISSCSGCPGSASRDHGVTRPPSPS